MRAITIRQPWAELIVRGDKDVENRSWRTRHRGPLLIHAGARADRSLLEQHGISYAGVRTWDVDEEGRIRISPVVTTGDPKDHRESVSS